MDSLQLNINLSFQQLLEVVKQLSPSEKLQLNDAIWDEASEIPVEHKKIVLERKQKSKLDSSRMLDFNEAIKKLKS